MASITIKDVAERAQVSVATVDRVLHERGGASAKARQRVKAAIHELGFGQLPSRLTQKARGRLRFLILLPGLEVDYIQEIVQGLKKASSLTDDIDIQIEIRGISLVKSDDIVKILDEVHPAKYNGVGLFAIDAPGVREAINETVERGVPVITLVSDIPQSKRVHFIGIDNLAAGRTAARLMGKFLGRTSGTIGLITGNQLIWDHVERLMGFRQIMGMEYRHFKLLQAAEGQSFEALNRSITIDLLRDNPDLIGIYSTAGGNAGVYSALREMNPSKRPIVIAHELTSPARKALQDGLIDAVIAQNPGHMARSFIRLLVKEAFREEINDDQERIRIEIYVAENLP